jgi:hypothetical protein
VSLPPLRLPAKSQYAVLLPPLLIADTLEGQPHVSAVIHHPRVNPSTAIERNTQLRQSLRLMDLQRLLPEEIPPSFGSNWNLRRLRTPRVMDLQCLLPAKSSPECKSNRNLLQLRSRISNWNLLQLQSLICRGRRALSNDQLRMNFPTGSVKVRSHLGRIRFVAIATSVVHATLIVRPTTSIENMNLARVASRRILVQR